MSASKRASGAILVFGAAILALTLIALSLHVPGSIWVGTLARKNVVVTLMLVSAALYGGAVTLVVRMRVDPRLIAPILAIAVALRIALLLAPPMMSSDIYRYIWDGRVQAAGINPYAYVPSDAALAPLRDAAIYPNINRADYARTIYPPAAQLIYATAGRISQTVTGMKAIMLLLEAAGIIAMLRLLAVARLPLCRILIYAWNPLAAWSVAGDGHIDGAAIGLLGLAMLASANRLVALAGALLAGAILTKFLPVAVAPALWHPRFSRPLLVRNCDWKMPAATAVTIVLLYALYAGAGWHVLGFLPTYTHEEGLAGGSGFWLLAVLQRAIPLPHWAGTAYVLLAAAVLATIAARMLFSRDPASPVLTGDRVAILAAGTTAAMSAHYPWYYAWLALPACLSVRPAVLWLSVAPLLLYSDPWHDEIGLQSAVFVPAIALAAYTLWHRLPHHMAMPAERSA
jgi:hypothetical protein